MNTDHEKRQCASLPVDTPLVSVIIASYNHAQYVREALMSVQAQTYPSIELIIIDDGSTDETAQIIKQTLSTFDRDLHVVFECQQNVGICSTLNHALALCKGTYIQFLGSDDAYLPEKTERSVAALRSANHDVAAVYCDGFLIDERSRRRGVFSNKYRVPLGRDTHRELLIANWLPAMGILYRFDVLVALGGFDPELKFEDWDLLLRLTKKHKINRLPDKLFLYRIHATNMTLDTAMMQETTASLMKKHSDFAAFNALKADLRHKPLRALIRHWRNYDLGLRVISRRLFTNRGIQGEAVLAAILSLLPLLAGRASMRVSAILNRLVGIRLGQQCKVGGRLKISGNRRNLRIGANVIFEGDAEFILPRGVGQGRVVIGDSCVIAQGALFNCMAGDLFLGPSSYVGRNVVLQSNGDLRIGAWTLIAANAGLYASNHVTSGKDQPIWTQGNSFTGITIGQNCWIGHGGVVVDGVNLGENSIVGPNTVVRGVHGPSSRLLLRID